MLFEFEVGIFNHCIFGIGSFFIHHLNEAVKCGGLRLKRIWNLTMIQSKRLQNSWFPIKYEEAITIVICLPSFLMEVLASQTGSVESLRKANDTPGNNSAYRNLNQHCSACARVKKKKKKMNPVSTLTLQPNFCLCFQSPKLIVLCNFHLKYEFILASLPQLHPRCADLTLFLSPSPSDPLLQ